MKDVRSAAVSPRTRSLHHSELTAIYDVGSVIVEIERRPGFIAMDHIPTEVKFGSSAQVLPKESHRPAILQSGPDAEEIPQDMNTAVRVVNDYWAQHWSNFFTGAYVAPKVVGLYNGSAPGAPTCAGETPGSDNAYYCRDGHHVAWDLKLMSRGFIYGDGWVYLAVAHEWGHAIQAQLSNELQSIDGERKRIAWPAPPCTDRRGTAIFNLNPEM